MKNNGIRVITDRFNLEDKNIYILQGILLPGVRLEAYLDEQPLGVEVNKREEDPTGRQGEQKVELEMLFPTAFLQYKEFLMFAITEKERKLCFRISTRTLAKKRKCIQVFIDQTTMHPEDGVGEIRGWCAATEPVEIEVFDFKKNKIDSTIEWENRKDVVALFSECKVRDKCGFHIKISKIPDKGLLLVCKTRHEELVKRINTSSIKVKEEKLKEQIKKASDYIAYYGFLSFMKKCIKKLRNRKIEAYPYDKWIQRHLPTKEELGKQRNERFAYMPKVSIVIPLYKTPQNYLAELINSIQAQSYENWELCLSDGSGERSPLTNILKEYEKKEPRIKVVHHEKQLHIADNTNAAIEIATGDFIAFADHDDMLTPNALYECVKAINAKPETEILYSDEDKVTSGNHYFQPCMKPDFNIDLLCTVNYICHLFVVKKTLIDTVGMLRSEFDGAQDYEFIFRCVEHSSNIYHIPKILYHWRFFEGSTAENPESKLYAFDAGERVINAHYKRMGIPAYASKGEYLGIYRTKYTLEEKTLISILIPNKDHIDDLKRCIDSIEQHATYRNYEFIVIENNSTEEETFAYYKRLEQENSKVKVVYYDGVFNYSLINNFGEQFANGEYLLLLNNDTEIINEDCLEELLGYCTREEVGAVGARLYYEDNTIQHAGVIIGFGGVAGHAFVQQKREQTGYCHRIICAQDYSAVTAACMMVKRSAFKEVGGLSPELQVAFNDIDFCMKLRKAGYLIVYNPYAELYHYESKSRGLEDTPEKIARFQREINIFQKRWPEILRDGDPYYSPNLTLESQDFSLKRI